MDHATGEFESIFELSTGDEDSLVSITSAQVIGTSSLVLSGHIGGEIFPKDSEVRIVEFAADGMRVVSEFNFPHWVLQDPLIRIDDQTLLGLDAYEERGFWLRKDSNGAFAVEYLSEEEIAKYYQHRTYQFAAPLGSEPMQSSNSRGTNLLVRGERLIGPAYPHGDVRCGWIRRDSGDVYTLLESGDVMRLQIGTETHDWVKVFEAPEEFRPLLKYGYTDWPTVFGATLREGEIWMARGKDRVALMRVDLNGDAAPEWEWLVNE